MRCYHVFHRNLGALLDSATSTDKRSVSVQRRGRLAEREVIIQEEPQHSWGWFFALLDYEEQIRNKSPLLHLNQKHIDEINKHMNKNEYKGINNNKNKENKKENTTTQVTNL